MRVKDACITDLSRPTFFCITDIGGSVGNVASISRGIGSFLDSVVDAASAEDTVDVASSSAVPTFTVVSSTDSEEEPLPKKSFSLPALAHDVTANRDEDSRLTSDGVILELADDYGIADRGKA